MVHDADPPTPDLEDGSSTRRRGIGLCLSGGGFRATLFHLGAIQRVFELGIATRPDFDTVASVSGGSITAAQWAIAAAQRSPAPAQRDTAAANPDPDTTQRGTAPTPSLRGGQRDAAARASLPLGQREAWPLGHEAISPATERTSPLNFIQDIRTPLQALAAKDLRSGALAKKFLLPWNWFRGAVAVDSMISRFETAFGKRTLNLLPESPRFIFCGTDMAFGTNFIFERDRVGSYQAGYARPEDFTLAQAVAASACFPPLFGPLRIDKAPERFKGGRAPGVTAEERRKILRDLRVTDGGVYDNMGLEPVWKNHRVVLVSDAGGLMDREADKNFFWRVKRYQSIQDTQARALRKRFLISGLTQGTIRGAYFGVASSTARYAKAKEPGYSKTFAMDVIANIRTDLDAFSEVEQAVLMNQGYALVDAAIRTHAPDLIATDAAFALPFPAFAPPAMEEDELGRRLAGSEKRKLRGRG